MTPSARRAGPAADPTPAGTAGAPPAASAAPASRSSRIGPRTPVRLGPRDASRVLGRVIGPLLAQGPILRRERTGRALERRDADSAMVATLADIATGTGHAPALLRVGGLRLLLPLHPEDARAVLDLSPDPFAPASSEKRAALAHFQPRGLLISPTRVRPGLRAWTQAALQTSHPVHDVLASSSGVLDTAARRVTLRAVARDAVAFTDVGEGLWAAARHVTLGKHAAADTRLTADLDRLRARANWAFALPADRRLRDEVAARVLAHVRHAPRSTLAGAGREHAGDELVASQVLHWLFAFDAARIVTWRALAVLAARPLAQDVLVDEALEAAVDPAHELPLARAAVLESARLWPTTLALLRQTTAATVWGDATVPAGTHVALVSAFVHRDPALRLSRPQWPDVDAFDPWPGGPGSVTAAPQDPLDAPDPRSGGFLGRLPALPDEPTAHRLVVSFSQGPVACPGRDVAVGFAARLLTGLVREARWSPASHPALAADPVPGTLAHHGLRLRAERRLP